MDETERARALDREFDRSERQERYQVERDRKHGLLYGEEYYQFARGYNADERSRTGFWAVLSDMDYETALYVVLVYLVGYAKAEVACGLNVKYSRVKYLCLKASRRARGDRNAE
jgi:hypothetical protein